MANNNMTENFFYAQINTDDIVVGVSMLGGEVIAPNMIRLTDEQWAMQPLGWTYDTETGDFIEPAPPEPEPAEYMSFQQAVSIRSLLEYDFDVPIETQALAQSALIVTSGLELPDLQEEAPWQPGEYVRDHVIREYGNLEYRVNQAHITRVGWEPPSTPALWSLSHGEWDPWVQPLGAHDAYPLGAKVTHNGQQWISTVDNNTWEPGVFGWDLAE